MSEGTKNLLVHFANHLISIGHQDVAMEILGLCGVAVVRVVVVDPGEGYETPWRNVGDRESLLELDLDKGGN